MSIETARENFIHATFDLVTKREPDQAYADRMFDRLLLEVRAEMPCYTYDPGNPHSNFTCREQVPHPEHWCQPCTARAALQQQAAAQEMSNQASRDGHHPDDGRAGRQ